MPNEVNIRDQEDQYVLGSPNATASQGLKLSMRRQDIALRSRAHTLESDLGK